MNKDINDIIENICIKEICGRKINEQPLCVLVGGLPGSGKTNLVKKIQEEYRERDFVIIDTDNYRRLHPNYPNFKKNPERAVLETSEFSNMIESILIKKAIEKHCDIISVTTLRATEAIDKFLCEPAIKAGYEIEASIMSVPISESCLSSQIRYERQIENQECPRFTPINFIELSLGGIKNTIQLLESKKEFIKIRIYNRGNDENSLPIEVYNNRENFLQYTSILEAFDNPARLLEIEKANELISKLYELKQKRIANIMEYSEIERLKELFEIPKIKKL